MDYNNGYYIIFSFLVIKRNINFPQKSNYTVHNIAWNDLFVALFEQFYFVGGGLLIN